MLYLGLLLLNSPFLPSGLSYITTPGIFLYLLRSLKVLVELSMHWFTLGLFNLLIFSAGLKSILDILDSSFLCHIFLLRGSFYTVEEYLDSTSMHDLRALYL